jgi:hypothetical protein
MDAESFISTYFSVAERDSGGFVDMVPSATVKTISKTLSPEIRVLALKGFVRFARRIHVSEATLWETVLSPPYADLGGGLFKFRIARPGEGTRGSGAEYTQFRHLIHCRAASLYTIMPPSNTTDYRHRMGSQRSRIIPPFGVGPRGSTR